jgi:hypothetical protein
MGEQQVAPGLEVTFDAGRSVVRAEYAFEAPAEGKWRTSLVLASGPHTVAVHRGENAGRTLQHDMVVRDLWEGTLKEATAATHEFLLPIGVSSKVKVVAFLQDEISGEIRAVASAEPRSEPV